MWSGGLVSGRAGWFCRRVGMGNVGLMEKLVQSKSDGGLLFILILFFGKWDGRFA